jgi:hypothetical protein
MRSCNAHDEGEQSMARETYYMNTHSVCVKFANHNTKMSTVAMFATVHLKQYFTQNL